MEIAVALSVALTLALALYAAGLGAAALSFLVGRLWGRTRDPEAASDEGASGVTVLVPARDEGAMALRVVRSLFDQDTAQAVHVVLLFADRSDTSWPLLVSAFPRTGGATTSDGDTALLYAGHGGHAGPRSLTVGFTGRGAKADKLNWALGRVTTPCVAVLDCDHQAHADWLRRATHRMQTTQAPVVQGRRHGMSAGGLCALWDSLHQHVGCEVFNTAFAQHDMSTFVTGTTFVAETALLMRLPLRPCLTEDTDLSYRLFLSGVRVAHEPVGGSDEEVSPDLYSFLARRRRWAHGHTEAFLRHAAGLWRAPLRWRDRVQLVFHGLHYLTAAAVLLLHLRLGGMVAHALPAAATALGAGVGLLAATAVSRTQRIGGWRTRASEVAILWAWFAPTGVLAVNAAVSGLLGDSVRLSPPWPEPALTLGLLALATPLALLLVGLAGFRQLTPMTALVVTLTWPLAFMLDVAGALLGLGDWLAGRHQWQAVARASTDVATAPPARADAEMATAVDASAPVLALAGESGGATPAAAWRPVAPDGGATDTTAATRDALTPVIDIPASWRLPAFGPRLGRVLRMALPHPARPRGLILWLALLAALVGLFGWSRASRLTVAPAPCAPLPHDSDPWIVRPERIPGYCETPAPPEGERWSRPRSAFTPAWTDPLAPIDLGRWERLASTFDCNLARFVPDNVAPAADGASLALTLRAQATADRALTAGAIATHGDHLYGRFEVTLKAARGDGLITAFFLHRRDPWQEIDVELLGRDPTKLLANVYANPGIAGDTYNHGFAGTPVLIDLGFDASRDFHRYALEWDVDEVRWLVDGRLVHRRRAGRPTPIPNLPMRLHANLWANCSEALVGRLSTAALPATATLRDVTVSGAAPSSLQALLGLFDGVLSDGPDGPRVPPVFWQDEAEWLQRGRLGR